MHFGGITVKNDVAHVANKPSAHALSAIAVRNNDIADKEPVTGQVSIKVGESDDCVLIHDNSEVAARLTELLQLDGIERPCSAGMDQEQLLRGLDQLHNTVKVRGIGCNDLILAGGTHSIIQQGVGVLVVQRLF